MDLYSSGTLTEIASTAYGVILNSVNIAGGVFVLELDLSDMVAADILALKIEYNVHASDGSKGTRAADDTNFLVGVQANPRWQSEPFVVDENMALYVAVYNAGAGAVTVPYRLFRLATPASVDSEYGAAYTTGSSIVLSSTLTGAFVLLFNGANSGDAISIKVTYKIDSEVFRMDFLNGYLWPDLFQSPPLLSSVSGAEVTIDFVAAAGSNVFSAKLMRVA